MNDLDQGPALVNAARGGGALGREREALLDCQPRIGDMARHQLAHRRPVLKAVARSAADQPDIVVARSEEHTSELQSLMRISYSVFCLKKKNIHINNIKHIYNTRR